MPPRSSAPAGLSCSFCTKAANTPEVKKVIAGVNVYICDVCVKGMVALVVVQRPADASYLLRRPELDLRTFTMTVTGSTTLGDVLGWYLRVYRTFPHLPKETGTVITSAACRFCSRVDQVVISRLAANICLDCLRDVAKILLKDDPAPSYLVRDAVLDLCPFATLRLDVDEPHTIGDVLNAYTTASPPLN